MSSGSHGQSVETTALQVIADELGVSMDDIGFTQGDSASTPYGPGTGGSRSAAIISGAGMAAAKKLRQRIVEVGSQLLEASPDDVEFVGGSVYVRGVPSRAMSLAEVAAACYLDTDRLPKDAETGLEVSTRYKAPFLMFSNACHAVTVEV